MSDWNIAAKPQEERDKVNVDPLPPEWRTKSA